MKGRSSGEALVAPGGRTLFFRRLPSVMAAGRGSPSLFMKLPVTSSDLSASLEMPFPMPTCPEI